MWDYLLLFLDESLLSLRVIVTMAIVGFLFLEKKEHFFLRFFSTSLVAFIIGGSFRIFSHTLMLSGYGLDELRFLHLVWYLLLLFILFAQLPICYNGHINEFLFTLCIGYLADCIIYSSYYALVGIFDVFPPPRDSSLFSVAAQFVFTIIGLLVLLILFKRHHARVKKLSIGKSIKTGAQFIFITLITMLILSIMKLLLDINALMSGQWFVALTNSILVTVILVIVIGHTKVESFNLEVAILNKIIHDKEGQYELAKENIDIINQRSHELKRQIAALRFMSKEEIDAALSDIENSVNVYESVVKTDNPVLNTIITEKALHCMKNNIKLTYVINGHGLDFIKPTDLYVLLGNVIDNAIEAVDIITDENKRFISLTIEEKGGLIIIKTDNYFVGKINFDRGIPKTTKKEELFHGIGYKSIRHVVDKYDGNFNILIDDDIYTLVITILCPA